MSSLFYSPGKRDRCFWWHRGHEFTCCARSFESGRVHKAVVHTTCLCNTLKVTFNFDSFLAWLLERILKTIALHIPFLGPPVDVLWY